MIRDIFTALIYQPLYNALVELIDIVPFADVGIAVIVLTVFVKILLFPLARQAIRTQAVLKKVQPRIEEIRKDYKDDQHRQVKETLALYKENRVHPLSGILTLIIQLPVIFGLYWVFFRGGLPVINTDLLYSFVQNPPSVNMMFLGFIDMGGRSALLAILAGATQFIHARIAIQPPQTNSKPGESIKDDIQRSMHLQMRYVLPIIVGVVSFFISAAVALYWTTSNIFTIGQELLVRKSFRDTQ